MEEDTPKQDLTERANQIRKEIESEKVPKSLMQSRLSRGELKSLVVERLASELGVVLDERGWGFKNPNDPRINEASKVVDELFQGS